MFSRSSQSLNRRSHFLVEEVDPVVKEVEMDRRMPDVSRSDEFEFDMSDDDVLLCSLFEEDDLECYQKPKALNYQN